MVVGMIVVRGMTVFVGTNKDCHCNKAVPLTTNRASGLWIDRLIGVIRVISDSRLLLRIQWVRTIKIISLSELLGLLRLLGYYNC